MSATKYSPLLKSCSKPPAFLSRKTSFSSSGFSEGGSSSDVSRESSKEPPVVVVRAAVKSYSKARLVLDRLDMTVSVMTMVMIMMMMMCR